jgi:hypothetical protein
MPTEEEDTGVGTLGMERDPLCSRSGQQNRQNRQSAEVSKPMKSI